MKIDYSKIDWKFQRSEPMSTEKFVKKDQGKLQWSLLPIDATKAIIKVLMFGAKKYTPNNWCLGCDWSRTYDALMRHMTAWWEREESDPESGFSHLWHAGCCCLFLIAYELRGIGSDNRPFKAKQ